MPTPGTLWKDSDEDENFQGDCDDREIIVNMSCLEDPQEYGI